MMPTYPSSGQVCDRAVYVVAVPAASLCGLLCICHPATHGKSSPVVPCGIFVSGGPERDQGGEGPVGVLWWCESSL